MRTLRQIIYKNNSEGYILSPCNGNCLINWQIVSPSTYREWTKITTPREEERHVAAGQIIVKVVDLN